ncbi:MAG TPA: DUF6188 family protein [Candidatus Saccharimonadales bacterium]|nr:DUF6188 family protein [Candidatus Saccharimonadales bacterium]
MTDSEKTSKILIGATVNYVRFSYQVDIGFLGGVNRKNKYAVLQIEAPFELIIKGEKYIVDPEDISTIAPAISLLHNEVVNIRISSDYILEVLFGTDTSITVKPVQKFEAWNISGDNIPLIVAKGT